MLSARHNVTDNILVSVRTRKPYRFHVLLFQLDKRRILLPVKQFDRKIDTLPVQFETTGATPRSFSGC